MIGYFIFIFSMALAITCISYNGMARSKGWPVGELLVEDASLPKIVAFITALWVIGKSFIIFNWWSPIAILIVGWITAFIITMSLKKYAQSICIIGIFPAFILTVLYFSEEKPFGWVHNIFS